MQDKITLAIDALASAAFVEGGVSADNTRAARDLTEQRKRELLEAIGSPCLHQISEPAGAGPKLHPNDVIRIAGNVGISVYGADGYPDQSLIEKLIDFAGIAIGKFPAAELNSHLLSMLGAANHEHAAAIIASHHARESEAAKSEQCQIQTAEPEGDYLEGVNIPRLREALTFLGSENGVGEGEVGAKLSAYVNSVVRGVLRCKELLRKPAQAALAAVPLPLLVRDIARDIGITVPEACSALKPLGNFSVNSVVTAEMARMLREHFPAPAHPAERVPTSEREEFETWFGEREDAQLGRLCLLSNDEYTNSETQTAWEAWQARAALAATPAADAPVVMPEPVDAEKETQAVMQLVADYTRKAVLEAGGNYPEITLAQINEAWGAIFEKVRALLAGVSAPAAQEGRDALTYAELLDLRRAAYDFQEGCDTDVDHDLLARGAIAGYLYCERFTVLDSEALDSAIAAQAAQDSQ